MSSQCFEVLKIALQAIAAIAVARATIWPALARFKSEKLWERQLAIYSDVVAALNDLIETRDEERWQLDEGGLSRERQRDNNQKTQAAWRKLSDARSLALIALPSLKPIVEQLDRDRFAIDVEAEGDPWEMLSLELNALEAARRDIIEHAQRLLGFSKSKHTSKLKKLLFRT